MTTIWQKIKRKLGKLTSEYNCSKGDNNGTSNHSQHKSSSVEQNPTSEVNNNVAKKSNKYSISNHTQTNTHSEHPITDRIAKYLTSKGWKFTHFPPKDSHKSSTHHISLGMQSEDMEWGYLFRINEENQLLSLYGVLPFSLSQDQISAGVALATQINYDLMIGNIEIDLRDGEIRFKNAMDTEYIELNDHILDYLTQSVTAMTRVIYQIFDELHKGTGQQHSLEEMLKQIQETSHNNTYFLASKSIQ